MDILGKWAAAKFAVMVAGLTFAAIVLTYL